MSEKLHSPSSFSNPDKAMLSSEAYTGCFAGELRFKPFAKAKGLFVNRLVRSLTAASPGRAETRWLLHKSNRCIY
ncbi:hypothetical protein DQG23_33900 [Paenibacillus contaminans]|uniref:Uncharacterized protein n=1 Tax=Paenibacillus contaminans TaxID=450362 RepID=A0A329LZT4_9BACL|nr:hypothetical protein DQG23_33900 [Paenibacillus contaminans]